MSQLISLGAINKITNEYVYPKIANKHDNYVCPDCNKDVVLVQGKILRHHFRHKTDKVHPCKYYDKPNESQIHKDAKMLMKTLLESKKPIQFMRTCFSCKKSNEIKLPEITEDSFITLEHRFNYQDELKIADVAHICDDEIEAIYEICHTHHTSSEDRPEPWVEIDAKSLLTSVNTNDEVLILTCIRKYIHIYDTNCEECIKKCDSICRACDGSGKSYWAEGMYGSCLECCCIDCGKFECICKKCEKCGIADLDGKCSCKPCEKCGKDGIHFNDGFDRTICDLCYDKLPLKKAKTIFMNWFDTCPDDMISIPPFDIHEYEGCCEFDEAIHDRGYHNVFYKTKNDIPSFNSFNCGNPDLCILDKCHIKYLIYFRKYLPRVYYVNILQEHGVGVYYVDPYWIISTKNKLGNAIPSNIEHKVLKITEADAVHWI